MGPPPRSEAYQYARSLLRHAGAERGAVVAVQAGLAKPLHALDKQVLALRWRVIRPALFTQDVAGDLAVFVRDGSQAQRAGAKAELVAKLVFQTLKFLATEAEITVERDDAGMQAIAGGVGESPTSLRSLKTFRPDPGSTAKRGEGRQIVELPRIAIVRKYDQTVYKRLGPPR